MTKDKTKQSETHFKNTVENIEGIEFISFIERKQIEVLTNFTMSLVDKLDFTESDISDRAKWITDILYNYNINGECIVRFFQQVWPNVFGKVILSKDYKWIKQLLLAQQGGFSLFFTKTNESYFIVFRLSEGKIEAYYGTAK